MLLKIKKLSAHFDSENGITKVLRNISIDIEAGSTVALVGESGSGKSVTALSILRLLQGVAPFSVKGRILFEGEDLVKVDGTRMRQIRGNRIAMIFQEPMTSLNPVYPVMHQLVEPLMIHQGLSRPEAETRAVKLLDRTGIPDPSTRIHSLPHQLSGGQRQRIMIAMALACRPALLIADEPTTALDVTIQAQILSLIKDIQKELGMAVLLITHDLAMVKKIADHVYIMHKGKIVENGRTKQIFESPKAPYTVHLLESVPRGEPENENGSKSEPILTIRDLKCHFPIKTGFFKHTTGHIKAVDNVNLTIRKGTTCGIVGESGSGKSTLGMCILRLTGCKGEIRYNGRDLLGLSNRSMRPLRRELQVVFQDPFSSLSPRLTIGRIIEEGLQVHKIWKNRKERRRSVKQTLIEVGLDHEMIDRYPHEFSGGERQRIAIARAIILKPNLILLDEPTSALDMTIQAQIIRLLRDLQKKYRTTYIFISHDLRVIRTLANDVAVMWNGRIVESGPAADIFNSPTHPYTKRLFSAAFGE
ncbi:MAG: ABC transporter ATP-binding protein [Desulfobulbaceae bacterium]|nr:ABC transporter ATP-binding protein [Desulfobulbaceae bacterium]